MTPSCKFLVVAAALLCLAAAASGGQQEQRVAPADGAKVDESGLRQTVDASSSSGDRSRSLLGRSKPNRVLFRFTSCAKNATVCLAKGSRGPNCCYGRCTNLKTDKFNCGRCGRACSEGVSRTCCDGKRVNVYTDPANCGACGQKCLSTEYCYRGLCNYNGLD